MTKRNLLLPCSQEHHQKRGSQNFCFSFVPHQLFHLLIPYKAFNQHRLFGVFPSLLLNLELINLPLRLMVKKT